MNKKLTLLLVLTLVLTILTTISCKKQPHENPNNVNVTINTTGIVTVPLEKSWSLSTWFFYYNNNGYNLTFTSPTNTYTYTKSIPELQAGFVIAIAPGTYTVTFTSEHSTYAPYAPLSESLDIDINETQIITASTTAILLNANHDDFLVVLDNNSISAFTQNPASGNTYTSQFFYDAASNSRYGYYNVNGSLSIQYTIVINSTPTVFTKVIPNATKNNIYHITPAAGGNVNVSIVPFNYNSIIW